MAWRSRISCLNVTPRSTAVPPSRAIIIEEHYGDTPLAPERRGGIIQRVRSHAPPQQIVIRFRHRVAANFWLVRIGEERLESAKIAAFWDRVFTWTTWKDLGPDRT